MDFLYVLSLFFEEHYFSSLIIGSLAALYFSRKRKALLLALVAILLLVPTAKLVYKEDRPTSSIAAFAEWDKYGFPSGHAASSIVLAAGTFGGASMFFFLPVALIVSFTRVYCSAGATGKTQAKKPPASRSCAAVAQ